MRLSLSVASCAFIAFCAVLLTGSLPACSPRSDIQTDLYFVNWQPDDDVRLSYGVLLLDQALREENTTLVLEACRLLRDVSPTSRPFVEAAAWLMLNRSPALMREVLQPVTRRFPHDINPHLLLAEAWLEDRQSEKAIDIIRRFAEKHPDSIQARQELGIFYTKAEKYTSAIDVFRRLPEKGLTPFVRYCYAKALVGTGEKPAAMDVLRKAVDDMPEFTEAWVDLASLVEESGDHSQAAVLYEHILEQEPNRHQIWLRLVSAYLNADEPQLALDAAKNYQSSGLGLSVVGLFLERGLHEEAEDLLDELRKNPDSSEELYFFMAITAIEGKKDLNKALEWLDRIPPENPYYERALRFRAQILSENEKPEEAIAVLHEAQKLFPDEWLLYLMEVHVLNKVKRFSESLGLLTTLTSRWPDNIDLRYARGMTLDLSGNKTEAFGLMEDIVKNHPQYYQALNYIGYSLAEQQRDLPRALKLLHEADRLAPDSAHILDSLAWAQFHAGQTDAAWSSIQRAVSLDGGDDAVIWEHYGDIATAIGDRQEARRGYTNALEGGHEEPDRIRAKMEKP